MQEQDPLGELPAAFFLQNVRQLHQQRLVILRVHSLALWKVINDEYTVLIPKNRGENFSSEFFALEIFWVWDSRYAATTVIVALSRSHSDITRFRPWSTVATDIIWIAPKKSKFAQTTGTVEAFDPRSGISGPISRRATACPNLHE